MKYSIPYVPDFDTPSEHPESVWSQFGITEKTFMARLNETMYSRGLNSISKQIFNDLPGGRIMGLIGIRIVQTTILSEED